MSFAIGLILLLIGLAAGGYAAVLYDEHHKLLHGVMAFVGFFAATMFIAMGFFMMSYQWPVG